MTSPKQIEELLKPYDLSLRTLPMPNERELAYEVSDRTKMAAVAVKWEGKHFFSPEGLSKAKDDFICHQSDVIELLCTALKWANNKLGV